MNNMSNGVISRGVSAPLIREGDNITNIVVESILNATKIIDKDGNVSYDINDKDVIGITESIVARSLGQYVTVDDIAEDIEKKYGKDYAKRSGYENDYMKIFNKEVSKNLSKSMYEFTKSNSHYKKATELVKKYDMLSWDELAKSNSEGINALRKQFEKK